MPRPRRVAVLALAAVAGACAGRSADGPFRAPGASGFEWADLRLRVRLVSSPPDRVRARGTLTNVGDRPLAREVPYCVVMLRIYRDGRRIWSDGARGGCFGRRVVRLEPGESRRFDRSLRAARILGDSLPAGPYLVRAYWPGTRRPGAVRTEMEVTLGEVRLEPPRDGRAPSPPRAGDLPADRRPSNLMGLVRRDPTAPHGNP